MRHSSGEGLFARLLGGPSRRTLMREIEDCLARARRVSEVPISQVRALCASRGIDLAGRYRTPRRNLYRRFLEHCLVDQAVSAEEAADLDHLRSLLQLEPPDVTRIHEEVSRSVYGAAVAEVLEDQRLDPDEEAFLRRLRDELQLSTISADAIYDEGRVKARQRYLDQRTVRDDFIVTSRDVTLELSGSSEDGFEDAVRSTLDEACRAVPDVAWAELTQLGAEVVEGRVKRWHVKLRAKRDPEE